MNHVKLHEIYKYVIFELLFNNEQSKTIVLNLVSYNVFQFSLKFTKRAGSIQNNNNIHTLKSYAL